MSPLRGLSPTRAGILRGPSSFGLSCIPVQTSSMIAHGARKHPLSEGDVGRDETPDKDPGRLEKTAGITLTPIITYKSNVSGTRQALRGLRFCPFSPTDSYLQVVAGSSQAWAQVATGWSPTEADGKGRHYITGGLQRSKLYICLLGSMTVERKDRRSLTC